MPFHQHPTDIRVTVGTGTGIREVFFQAKCLELLGKVGVLRAQRQVQDGDISMFSCILCTTGKIRYTWIESVWYCEVNF